MKLVKYIVTLMTLILLVILCEEAQATSYTPHMDSLAPMGEKGGKYMSWTSGKKLVYDVYSGVDGKSNWSVEDKDYGKGAQPYLRFSGWSALVGYTHHNLWNQSTYILAESQMTGRQLMYKAEMTSADASKDLEYNRKSQTGPIYNPCSSEPNKRNDECNMYYENVGFNAYIPLNELFPPGATDDRWFLKIVKRVGNNIVYDDLKVPFEFADLNFNLGKVSLNSGLHAKTLIMADDGVIRRLKPRGTDWAGVKYFTQNGRYVGTGQDEENVVVWHKVDVSDDSRDRWAPSTYWLFGGDPAVLSYKISYKTCPDGSRVTLNQSCTIDVKIKHVDAKTKNLIKEEKQKLTVGDKYKFLPEEKGTFKDREGNPYVPAPENQIYEGIAPDSNLEIIFEYKVSLKDPTRIEEMPGSTVGKSNGTFFWELRRIASDKTAQTYLESRFNVTGKHYEIRNVKHSISTKDVFTKVSEKPVTILLDTASLANQKLNYDFEYEYTNHYSINYVCTDKQGDDCFEWKFKDHTPAWSHKKVYHAKDSYKDGMDLLVNTSQGKTFTIANTAALTNLNNKIVVGQKKTVDFDKNSTKPSFSKVYYETFSRVTTSKVNDVNNLKTQSHFEISPGQIDYNIELPSNSHESKSFAFQHTNASKSYYYAVDVDPNLQELYKNRSNHAYTKYAFPLMVEKASDQGVKGTNRNYRLDFTSDYFFTGKHTGFIQPYEYTKQLVDKKQPTLAQIKSSVEKIGADNYQKKTGHVLNDTFLHLNSYQKDKYSRYYVPIDAKTSLKTKQLYENKILLNNMGMSDVTLIFAQQFKFDHYLVGDVQDNAFMVEQVESVVDVPYTNKVSIKNNQIKDINSLTAEKLKNELLHGFRNPDRTTLYEKLKKIIRLDV